MRRVLACIALLVALSALAACFANVPLPYGKWENREIGLTLNIIRQNGRLFQANGTFVVDGVETDVYIRLPQGASILDIIDTDGTGRTLFSGSYRVIGDQLNLNLNQRTRERTGLREIVFNRITDYN